MEIWKNIEGFEGSYQISNLGRVKSLERKIFRNGSFYVRKEMILKQQQNKFGYHLVLLYPLNRGKVMVHRLVATHFLPNIENKKTVNHINGNKADNNIKNLEWVTQSENIIHAYKIGLKKPLSGEINGFSKLTQHEVNEIRKKYELDHYKMKDLAKTYNTSQQNISLIINNKRWTKCFQEQTIYKSKIMKIKQLKLF